MTAFSVSVPPTSRVFGTGLKDAAHQIGNNIKPIKKHQACSGERSSSSDLKRSDHSVGIVLGGFRGSCMWYALERLMLIDGACGVTSALSGIDTSERLRRRSVVVDSGRAFERIDVEWDPIRDNGGAPLRLGQEPLLADVGREWPGEGVGVETLDKRGRLR